VRGMPRKKIANSFKNSLSFSEQVQTHQKTMLLHGQPLVVLLFLRMNTTIGIVPRSVSFGPSPVHALHTFLDALERFVRGDQTLLVVSFRFLRLHLLSLAFVEQGIPSAEMHLSLPRPFIRVHRPHCFRTKSIGAAITTAAAAAVIILDTLFVVAVVVSLASSSWCRSISVAVVVVVVVVPIAHRNITE